jgi:hypothetical protein
MFYTDSIEWFIEGQASSLSYNLAPSPPLSPVSKLERQHTVILRKRVKSLTGEGGRGWARSRIIRSQESLVLCKAFNTLWFNISNIMRWHWKYHVNLAQCKLEQSSNLWTFSGAQDSISSLAEWILGLLKRFSNTGSVTKVGKVCFIASVKWKLLDLHWPESGLSWLTGRKQGRRREGTGSVHLCASPHHHVGRSHNPKKVTVAFWFLL